MTAKIGIGFIGVGAVAELHRRALLALESGRLVAACGVTEADKARGREWGVRIYDHAMDLVHDPAVDAVFVLSPVEYHCEHVLLALDAGKPVFVEKPVAWTVDEIRRIEVKAAEAGLPCMPGHNYIYDPALWRAKRLLAGGELGRVCMTWIVYTIHHTEELAAHYPGVLRQIMPHHLYTLLYLQGMPQRVFASVTYGHRHLPQEDQAALQLEMGDGALAQLFCTFAADDETSQPWTFMVKILGSEGGIVHTWRDALTTRRSGTHSRTFISYEESFRNEDEYFLVHCLQGEAPLSTLHDAHLVQTMIDAALESIKTGRCIPLPAMKG
jgi:predicted dehydrogenase